MLGISIEIAFSLNATKHHWRLVKIGSGNSLVPSENKPWTEPLLTKISAVILCH